MVQLSDTPIILSREVLSALALEAWRLGRAIEDGNGAILPMSISYPSKKLKDIIQNEGITYLDMTGKLYDSGMAVDVLDTEEDMEMPEGELRIKEMIKPVILWQNSLLSHGEAILLKGTKPAQKSKFRQLLRKRRRAS